MEKAVIAVLLSQLEPGNSGIIDKYLLVQPYFVASLWAQSNDLREANPQKLCICDDMKPWGSIYFKVGCKKVKTGDAI